MAVASWWLAELNAKLHESAFQQRVEIVDV